MPFNFFSASSWTNLGNTIASGGQQVVSGATSVVNTVLNETPKAINIAGKAITDATGKITADGVAFSNQTIADAKSLPIKVGWEHYQVADARMAVLVNAIASKVTPEQLDQVSAGIKLAITASQSKNAWGWTVDAKSQITRSGQIIAEWCVANQCKAGVSAAVGALGAASLAAKATGAKLTPLNALAVMCAASKESVAKSVVTETCNLSAAVMIEYVWLSPDVRRSVGEENKKLLQDAIAFTLAKTLLASAGALIVPQSAEAVLWGILATLLAGAVCDGNVPQGAREWGAAGAQGFI